MVEQRLQSILDATTAMRFISMCMGRSPSTCSCFKHSHIFLRFLECRLLDCRADGKLTANSPQTC